MKANIKPLGNNNNYVEFFEMPLFLVPRPALDVETEKIDKISAYVQGKSVSKKEYLRRQKTSSNFVKTANFEGILTLNDFDRFLIQPKSYESISQSSRYSSLQSIQPSRRKRKKSSLGMHGRLFKYIIQPRYLKNYSSSFVDVDEHKSMMESQRSDKSMKDDESSIASMESISSVQSLEKKNNPDNQNESSGKILESFELFSMRSDINKSLKMKVNDYLSMEKVKIDRLKERERVVTRNLLKRLDFPKDAENEMEKKMEKEGDDDDDEKNKEFGLDGNLLDFKNDKSDILSNLSFIQDTKIVRKEKFENEKIIREMKRIVKNFEKREWKKKNLEEKKRKKREKDFKDKIRKKLLSHVSPIKQMRKRVNFVAQESLKKNKKSTLK